MPPVNTQGPDDLIPPFNLNDFTFNLHRRATMAYQRRCLPPTPYREPKKLLCRFEEVGGQTIYLLQDEDGPIMSFCVHPDGRLGQVVDTWEGEGPKAS